MKDEDLEQEVSKKNKKETNILDLILNHEDNKIKEFNLIENPLEVNQ